MVVLICISLMNSDVEHFFIYLLAICMPSLGKFLFSFLPIFEIQLFASLTLSYMNLIYFWISTPNQTLHLQRPIYSNAANFVLFGFDYGLPFSRLHFPFVDGFLQFCLTFSCSVAFHSLLPQWTVALSFPVLHYLPEFTQTHVH